MQTGGPVAGFRRLRWITDWIADKAITTAKIALKAITFDRLADGAFPTREQAEAGESAVHLMTPQRTKEAIAAQAPSLIHAFGRINADGNRVYHRALVGSGRLSTGRYRIAFATTEFPVVLATAETGASVFGHVVLISQTTAEIEFKTSAGAPINTSFFVQVLSL